MAHAVVDVLVVTLVAMVTLNETMQSSYVIFTPRLDVLEHLPAFFIIVIVRKLANLAEVSIAMVVLEVFNGPSVTMAGDGSIVISVVEIEQNVLNEIEDRYEDVREVVMVQVVDVQHVMRISVVSSTVGKIMDYVRLVDIEQNGEVHVPEITFIGDDYMVVIAPFIHFYINHLIT